MECFVCKKDISYGFVEEGRLYCKTHKINNKLRLNDTDFNLCMIILVSTIFINMYSTMSIFPVVELVLQTMLTIVFNVNLGFYNLIFVCITSLLGVYIYQYTTLPIQVLLTCMFIISCKYYY